MDNLKVPELSKGKANNSNEIYVHNDGTLPVEGQNQLTILDENLREGILIKQWLMDLIENSKISINDSDKYLTSLGNSVLTEGGFIDLNDGKVKDNKLSEIIESINLHSIDYAINEVDSGYDYVSTNYDIVSNDTVVYPEDNVDNGVVFYRYMDSNGDIYTGKVSFTLDSQFDKLKINISSAIYLYLVHYLRDSTHYLKILTPQGGDVIITRVQLYKDTGWEDRGNVILTEQYQMTICDEEGVPIILE